MNSCLKYDYPDNKKCMLKGCTIEEIISIGKKLKDINIFNLTFF